MGSWPFPSPTLPATNGKDRRQPMPKAVKRITLDFDAEALDRIDEAARAVAMSRAGWIKGACQERLDRQQRGANRQKGD